MGWEGWRGEAVEAFGGGGALVSTQKPSNRAPNTSLAPDEALLELKIPEDATDTSGRCSEFVLVSRGFCFIGRNRENPKLMRLLGPQLRSQGD